MSIGLDNNYALLIGVGNYVNPEWASLPATVNDVRALKSLLTDPNRCGYIDDEQHVCLLHDETATKERILAGLQWLEEKAKSNSEATVIIYYSGHGHLDKKKKYYLVPRDSDNLLCGEDFNQAVQRIQAKRLLLVLDCCHAAGMATAKDRIGIVPMAFPKELITDLKNQLEQELKQGQGRAVFSSSTEDQQSWILGNMSIFTVHFLEALQGAGKQPGNNVVYVLDLMNYLEKAFNKTSDLDNKQTPYFQFAGENNFPVALLPKNWRPPQPTNNDDLYVKQPVVKSCYNDILKPGCLLRIKAPRQMGKTILMSNIQQLAINDKHIQTARLSLYLAEESDFDSLEKFLKWFCTSVSQKLDLTPQVDKCWLKQLNNKNNFQSYFVNHLLHKEQPLALFLDDVDKIFRYENIAADFLGLIRTCHEDAKNNDNIWKNFRLVMTYREIYYKVKANQSPFNVGIEKESTDLEFKQEQVQELVERYGLDLTQEQVKQLMEIVGGHPYLVNTALYHLKHENKTLEELLNDATTLYRIYSHHLSRYEDTLKKDTELKTSFKEIVMADTPIGLSNPEHVKKLTDLGLVKSQHNHVDIRYELYRKYFRICLGESDEYST